MHHDFLIARNASYASNVLGMVQERGALSQELVILIILIVIALALILVCGVLGRRETQPKGGEMGPAKPEPSAAARTEATIGHTGPVAEAEAARGAERGATAVEQKLTAPAGPVAELGAAVVPEEPTMPARSILEAAESLVAEEESAMPAEPLAGVAEVVAVEETAAPAGSVSELAEAIVAEQPAAPAEQVAEVSQVPEAAEAIAAPPRPDDLKVIEGIGPKVARLLNEAGIFTFAQLAEADPAQLKQILEAARLQMMDPTSWPDQARLAAVGDWEALKQMQDSLKGGRR